MKYSELSAKKVVNMKDGSILGMVMDLEIEIHQYQIYAIYVGQNPSCFKKMLPWFFHAELIKITVDEIINIGEDVILVKVC